MKIAIIDCDSLMFSIANPIKLKDEYGNYIVDTTTNLVTRREKTEEELISTSTYIFNSILNKTNSTHYIGFIKGCNTTNFRININSDYKLNRSNLAKPKWWDFLKNHLIEQFEIIEVNNIEVDDAVLITYKNIPDSFICAIDKDLLNIEGTHYNFRTEEWITNTRNHEINYLAKQMIIGDTIDNIKGLPGRGESYFNKNLKEINNEIGFTKVLEEYIKHFNNDLEVAIDNFYKNFKCLYILRKSEGFLIPKPIEYNKFKSE